MGRPRNQPDKQGKSITLYLTSDRLVKLGSDPRATLYRLIDGMDDGEEVQPPTDPVRVPEPAVRQVERELSRIKAVPPSGGKWICRSKQHPLSVANFGPTCDKCGEKRP